MFIPKRFPAFALILAVMFAAYPANAQQDAAKREAVIELMRVSKMVQLTEQVIEQITAAMIQQMRQKKPNIPQEAVDIMSEEMVKAFREQRGPYFLQITKLYEKYFTTEELQAITAFFRTPAGAKTLTTLPQLLQESMVIGQNWGRQVAPLVVESAFKRLEAAGYKVK